MEMSSFGNKQETQQQQQQQQFPRTNFENSNEDEAATQLQRELELFAQDDEEESSLINTGNMGDPQSVDYERRGRRSTGLADDEAEIKEYENYFNQ